MQPHLHHGHRRRDGPGNDLRSAADYLVEHGWCTHRLFGEVSEEAGPAASARGAIRMVVFGTVVTVPDVELPDPHFDPVVGAVCELAAYLVVDGQAPKGDDKARHVVDAWNDCPDQTADHVVATMRAAADLSEHARARQARAAVTLHNAATYLATHGWIQGAYYAYGGAGTCPSACTVGAIGMVCYGSPVATPAQMFDHPGFDEFETAVSFLDALLTDEYGQDVYSWNDDRARTQDDVLHVLAEVVDTYKGHSTLDGAR
jgi:hypothetical protein